MTFQRADDLYNLSFGKGPSVKVGEIKIEMPKMPSEKEMVNYHLPSKKQKFVKRPVPRDIMAWDQDERDEYVAAEWHRRWNGYWILIKGDPYYIPGNADLYFNHWLAEFGGIPEFRYAQLEWWWFWWNIERDPNCFGMLDIKCRRLGDTEMALCATWDRSTKWTNSPAGIIHIKEDSALENYQRLVTANMAMPWFFRPVNTGTTRAKSGTLDFSVPEERITKAKLESGDWHLDTEVGLGSKIRVSPAVTGSFDGVRLRTYYSDEIFKVKSSKFDIKKQWGIIKPTLSLKNDTEIVGKAIKTSTVEEMEDGATVELAEELWNKSNPNDRGPDGRTVTGLYRIFRGFDRAAEADEWGFPKVKEATDTRNARLNDLRKRKDYTEILSIYRKQPADINEALSSPIGECILFPELCEERLKQLDACVDRVGNFIPRGTYGTLRWTDEVFGSDVYWTPDPTGKWYISQHPEIPNNRHFLGGRFLPGNMATFRMGIDPYDSAQIQGEGSDGAFMVKRRLNLAAEPEDIKVDPSGLILNPDRMFTNQPVCDYQCRPDDPYTFYEDCYKTMVYYGIASFPERNKDGFYTWMLSNDLKEWVQVQPPQLRPRGANEKDPPRGANSTDKIIDLYIDRLKLHIPTFVWCNHHPRVLKQWKAFTRKNRTKYDLGVASGFTELGDLDERYEKKTKSRAKWKVHPAPRYEYND